VKGKAGTRGKHAIIAFPREPGMATTIQNWKKFGAGKYSVDWQRDFFDHRLRDHREVEEKTSYILMNPVRRECVSVLRNGFGFFIRIIVRRGVTSSGRARTPMRAEVCPGRRAEDCPPYQSTNALVPFHVGRCGPTRDIGVERRQGAAARVLRSCRRGPDVGQTFLNQIAFDFPVF
jgi:hypothetical protein